MENNENGLKERKNILIAFTERNVQFYRSRILFSQVLTIALN
jgi:hypothetical protein